MSGRGYGRWRCPTAARLIRKYESKIRKEKCVQRELGWAEGSDEENLAVLTQDLLSLPGTLGQDILADTAVCAASKVEAWSNKIER